MSDDCRRVPKRCIGENQLLRISPDEINAYVERWQQGLIGSGLELREPPDMVKREYARSMENADAIRGIKVPRKTKHPTVKA